MKIQLLRALHEAGPAGLTTAALAERVGQRPQRIRDWMRELESDWLVEGYQPPPRGRGSSAIEWTITVSGEIRLEDALDPEG